MPRKRKPQLSTSYKLMHEKLDELLRNPDHQAFDLCLATVLANKMPGDAVAMFLVSPPSSGKTEYILAMKGVPWTYEQSRPTPKAFASGLRTTKNDSANTPNSLLYRLKEKGQTCLLLKEFTSVLTMHPSERDDVIGQYRDILDGNLYKDFGTGVRIKWEGRLGMLAGVTPQIEHSWSAQRQLGDRWVYVRPKVPSDMDSRIDIARSAIQGNSIDEQRRTNLRAEVQEHLQVASKKKPMKLNKNIELNLAEKANFLAMIRTPIQRDATKDIVGDPQPEGPARLAKTFGQLAQTIALIRGHKKIEQSDLTALDRVVRDTAPSDRLKVWVALSAGHITVKEIIESTKLRETTVRRAVEELDLIGCINGVTKESNQLGRKPSVYSRSISDGSTQ